MFITISTTIFKLALGQFPPGKLLPPPPPQPPTLILTLTLNQTLTITGGQLSSGAIVRTQSKLKIFYVGVIHKFHWRESKILIRNLEHLFKIDS